jgi:hypothetical protein
MEAVSRFACRMIAPSRLLAAFGLSLLLAGGPFGIRAADAQSVCNGGPSCTVVVSLQLPRPYVASLVLSQSVTSLPMVTSSDFAAGFRDQAGPQLRVKANAPYRVTIQAAVSTWQYSGVAPAARHCGPVECRRCGAPPRATRDRQARSDAASGWNG